MLTVMVPHVTYRHYDLTDAEVMILRDCIVNNRKVFGIKFLRTARLNAGPSHFGLKEAKDLYEAFEKQEIQTQRDLQVQQEVQRAAMRPGSLGSILTAHLVAVAAEEARGRVGKHNEL